ncbi:DUF1488 domain-containing protein [Caballeronia sp. AZ1_KS37]|uniref:DUF1488 domain-containing protein n=1 Tax=Caballeronia sp. AZ1_KS37 TaxID=2921756 RepID=UPI0032EB2F80
MNITFLAQAPIYLSDEPALLFTALVDDRSVECTISAEALEDHFGAASLREEDLQRAFENNRAVIEGAAEQLLTSVGCRPVMLRSGYFRFSGKRMAVGMEPRHARSLNEGHRAGNGSQRGTHVPGGE